MGLLHAGGLFFLSFLFGSGSAAPVSSNDSYTCVDPGTGFRNSFPLSYHNATWAWQTYETTSFLPPNLSITANGESLGPGYAFITPMNLVAGKLGTRSTGGWIMSERNELIYGTNDSSVGNLHVQKYKGKDYLTFWHASGAGAAGAGYGSFVMLDNEYKQAYNICMDLGLTTSTGVSPKCQFDNHEQYITPRNTLVVPGTNYTQANLTSVNGPANGYILDSHFFEVDIETRQVLFSWNAAAHVPLNASKLPLAGRSNGTAAAPWDYFHINSIQAVGDDYLVNSRNAWTTYMIDGKTGDILWSIEGRSGDDFGSLPDNAEFSWQHHVRAHNVSDTSLSLAMFADNNAAETTTNATMKASIALLLNLPLPPNKSQPPTILRHLETSEDLYAGSQGSYQPKIRTSDTQFVGYGQIAVMREFGSATDGSDLRWEARFGADNLVSGYRAYKQEWHGTPADWDPSVTIRMNGASSNTSLAYVSWNGATDVRGWNVYNGPSNDTSAMRMVGSVPVRGFETGFTAPYTGCVLVEAEMEGGGRRRSNVACRTMHT